MPTPVKGVFYIYNGVDAFVAPGRPSLPTTPETPQPTTGLGRDALGTSPLGGS